MSPSTFFDDPQRPPSYQQARRTLRRRIHRHPKAVVGAAATLRRTCSNIITRRIVILTAVFLVVAVAGVVAVAAVAAALESIILLEQQVMLPRWPPLAALVGRRTSGCDRFPHQVVHNWVWGVVSTHFEALCLHMAATGASTTRLAHGLGIIQFNSGHNNNNIMYKFLFRGRFKSDSNTTNVKRIRGRRSPSYGRQG